VSFDVDKRWAAHINIELARVGAHEQIVSEARARSVVIIRRDDGILRLGSLALVALVQLPDGAGVDAAWGALSSIPDVDAAIARAGADPAAGQALREEVARELAEGPGEASSRETPASLIEAERARLAGTPRLSAEDAEALRGAGWGYRPDGRWRDPSGDRLFDPGSSGGARALRGHAARIRAKAEQARRDPRDRAEIEIGTCPNGDCPHDAWTLRGQAQCVCGAELVHAGRLVLPEDPRPDEPADIKRALAANDWRLGPVAAPPDPRWPAALWREADEVERHNPELAERIRAALAIGVRGEREARLVLAALGYSNPDAVERVLQGEDEEAEPEAAIEQRIEGVLAGAGLSSEALPRESEEDARERFRASATPIADAWVRGGAREVFATSETPEPARRASTLIFVPDGVEPETPAPGAMRPETRRRIEGALAAMPRSAAPPWAIHAAAMAEIDCAERGPVEKEPDHILRAIAYLVRRLELEAPAPEQGRDEPR
jgi:hypothetical protein